MTDKKDMAVDIIDTHIENDEEFKNELDRLEKKARKQVEKDLKPEHPPYGSELI